MEQITNSNLHKMYLPPFILILTVGVAALMVILSGMGILIPDFFYPDPGLRENYLANDPVNIILGLPLFLAGMILIKKGRLLGSLLLPGALIYIGYNYIGYGLGRPWDWLAFLYLGLAILSMIALLLFLMRMDHQTVKAGLEGNIPGKVSGWILVVFGIAFIALAISTISEGIKEGAIPPLGEHAVSIADIVVSLGWVSGGILLLRKKPLGYSTGLGLLVAASFLFIGLILFFFFAPLVSNRPFDWTEVITVLVMGLICFVPTGLFWNGVLRSFGGEDRSLIP
jgi:hypothetical protein